MEQLIANNLDIFLRLGVALVLGMIIGAERIIHKKPAGMRTYAMVAMGSALFVVISEMLRQGFFVSSAGFNPIMMAANIIIGVGFLGAGVIMLRHDRLMGLTTASGLWVSAGIGIASGFGFYNVSLIATILTIFIFTILFFVEEPFKKISEKERGEPE